MKLGKAKLKRILSDETGIPIKDITIYGRYEYYGNKERLVIGSHTIIATNGRVFVSSPVIREDTEDVTYRSREIKIECPHEPASSDTLINNQLYFSRKEKEWKVLKSTNLKSKM